METKDGREKWKGLESTKCLQRKKGQCPCGVNGQTK